MHDRVVVKPGRCGEPDSGGMKVAEYPGAAFAEGLSSEGLDEVAIVSEVPPGFGIEPTENRIGRERHHDRVDCTSSINLRNLHERLSLGYLRDHGDPFETSLPLRQMSPPRAAGRRIKTPSSTRGAGSRVAALQPHPR